VLPKPNTYSSAQDFIDGTILVVDKPAGWTSFDVVNKLRYGIKRLTQIKRIKVGHAGTLDPLATGVLVVCTGKMTKQITTLIADDKEYVGTITLGGTTPSFDLETEIDKTFPVDHITEELIEAARLKFVGEIFQVPPIFSAKKIDGKPAYKAARRGEEVKMRKTVVTISELEFTKIEMPNLEFRMRCTKGTYVRSFANDLGQELQSGAHLSLLRRTASGAYRIEEAADVTKMQDEIWDLSRAASDARKSEED
jgi:tRNA pseudouridine55 synthase